jgi:type VI secretion system protein ImpM
MAPVSTPAQKQHQSSLGWFGKLPCVGDFCCHGISNSTANALDNTLSTAMQLAVENHPQHWQQAYFNAPAHGFVWNQAITQGDSVSQSFTLGVLMPSVDRAGRAFPFVLVESFEITSALHTPCCVKTWMNQALQIASSALDKEWPLERLRECSIQAEQRFDTSHDAPDWPESGMSHWYRLEHSAQHFSRPLVCQGLASPSTLLALWNIESR